MLFVHSDDIENAVLYMPALISGLSCHSLRIVTGFMDCGRIFTHLIALRDGASGKDKVYVNGIRIEIILGMTKGANLTLKKHQKICDTIARINQTPGMPHISCRYIYNGKEVHSKVYVWSNHGNPQIAYCGSANYTINAFQKRRECMVECDANDAVQYYESLLGDSIDCMNTSIMSFMHFSEGVTIDAQEEIDDDNLENLNFDDYKNRVPIDTLRVSLLKANGGVGFGSGINWGIRPNGTKRDRNQAYIPYNVKNRKEGFFPDRINPDDKNCPLFKVITKEMGAFYMRMAQQNNKGLHSAENNAIIGKWIRQKLGIPDGEFVTLECMLEYGATEVIFKKFSNGVYTLEYEPETHE